MKSLFFCAAVMAATPAYAESARLPIKASIVNLAAMPIEQALNFCDQRNLDCPAIRIKAAIEERQRDSRSDDNLKVAGL